MFEDSFKLTQLYHPKNCGNFLAKRPQQPCNRSTEMSTSEIVTDNLLKLFQRIPNQVTVVLASRKDVPNSLKKLRKNWMTMPPWLESSRIFLIKKGAEETPLDKKLRPVSGPEASRDPYLGNCKKTQQKLSSFRSKIKNKEPQETDETCSYQKSSKKEKIWRKTNPYLRSSRQSTFVSVLCVRWRKWKLLPKCRRSVEPSKELPREVNSLLFL